MALQRGMDGDGARGERFRPRVVEARSEAERPSSAGGARPQQRANGTAANPEHGP
jgi:hypothetical protein